MIGGNWCSQGNKQKSSGVGSVKSYQSAYHVIERKIPMADGLPIQSTGRWTFHLQLAQTLQFHITSEQSGQILIEGHDISTLLDYLYDHRELIYDATHDRETRRLEAMEAFADSIATQLEQRRVEPILYLDDGKQRTRANI
jgi:hypothetical protein